MNSSVRIAKMCAPKKTTNEKPLVPGVITPAHELVKAPMNDENSQPLGVWNFYSQLTEVRDANGKHMFNVKQIGESSGGNDSIDGNSEAADDGTSEDFTRRHSHDSHQDDDLCSDASGCAACSVRDCPHGAVEHYWHDGCPSCTYEAEQQKKSNCSAAVEKK